ncbi:MAG: DUF1553 domain-containing protein [Planctomycetota bacterium]|nr:DUF1553 domain-containing protein [Planctomycetota bacterium]MDA0920019.1 DUF1553 domain-containing protein [Planctomycetota bacterium]
MRPRCFTCCLLLVVGILLVVAPDIVQAQGKISFNRDVLPILSDRCFLCHGPDEATREAELRFDIEGSVPQEIIAPGHPEKSEFFHRITSDDSDVRMPPVNSKLALTKDEIDILGRWIKEGAKWQQHWSFIAPQKSDLPKANNAAWCRNEIDHFILARQEEAGLLPATPASKERLIRRLSFDLTGLPPSLTEIDEFLNDDRPDAVERVVDRLLKSSAYGERMATDWLDAARYSDTYGYQVDRDRFVWPWRDWVVRAFNQNMPYDQFVTEQLAGDLLPGVTDEQILATTFNRLHPQKVEGGSVPEEFRIEYVADRTQTFATAFLGLTMECCRCHDHKYDPLSQKEYYQLSAFFDNIAEAGLYSYFTPSVPTPTLVMADEATKAKIAAAERDVENAETALKALADSETTRNAFKSWLESKPKIEKLIPGQVAHLTFEDAAKGGNESVDGKLGKAVKLSGDDAVGLSVGNFRRFDPFSVSLWMNTPDVKDRAVVFHRSRAWTDAGSRGYQLLIEEGRLSASLIHFWPGNAIRIRTKQPLSTNQWHHVVVTWDGSSRADGLRIYLNGDVADCDVVRDNLYKNITGGGGDNLAIGERFRDRGFKNGLVDEFQVFDRQLTTLEVAHLSGDKTLSTELGNSTSPPDSQELFDYYLATVDADFRAQLAAIREKREAHSKVVDALPEIMVMREEPTRRETFLLKRGAYDARTTPVIPETPAVLSTLPDASDRNRLGLARWLTQPDHPLTARVVVNRLWQMIFGQGLVRTPEDFGRQGQPPTHPELLDWLAVDFVENGWNVKRLLRQIVLSATYRQSSEPSADSFKRDPQNLLLSWSPTFRLPAEMLRDNALAASGLLVRKLGGAPAKPYEVEVSFKPVTPDKGEGLYRRSLYTYWKRTGPAPVMMTLDASKRDVCRVRRERTSTPLETFVLMNGPQFVEAARVLSEAILKQHADDDRASLSEIFRTLTGRLPAEDELEILAELHAQQLEYFVSHAGQAAEYLKTGQRAADASLDANRLAALSTVANALFSFDEVVNRR